jgi:DNA-binding transcriptional regulator YiaG
MRRKPRSGTLSGSAFRALRHQLQLSVQDLALLLGCNEQSIRNIESQRDSGMYPSYQIMLLMRVLQDPHGQAILREAARERLAQGEKDARPP